MSALGEKDKGKSQGKSEEEYFDIYGAGGIFVHPLLSSAVRLPNPDLVCL